MRIDKGNGEKRPKPVSQWPAPLLHEQHHSSDQLMPCLPLPGDRPQPAAGYPVLRLTSETHAHQTDRHWLPT